MELVYDLWWKFCYKISGHVVYEIEFEGGQFRRGLWTPQNIV